MKTCIAITATAFIMAATFDSAHGLAKYLDELPNGSSFSQELGHPGKDISKFTDFATAFADAGHSWSTDFCGKTFPGASMTNGEAFGDPWKKGGTPDFTVTAFTTTPGKATVCASTTESATSSTALSTAGSSATTTPSATTASPSTAYTEAPTPSTTTAAPATSAPEYTDAPTTTPSTTAPQTQSPSSGGCAVKADGGSKHGKGGHSYRRFRH